MSHIRNRPLAALSVLPVAVLVAAAVAATSVRASKPPRVSVDEQEAAVA